MFTTMTNTERILDQRLQQLLRSMNVVRWNAQPHPVLVAEFTRVHRLLDREHMGTSDDIIDRPF